MTGDPDPARAREAVARNPLWYHTIDVAPGVSTPGVFDLRPVVGLLPWPDVRGKRCLDVGTYDGYLAFELERRGAAEVVVTDIAGHADNLARMLIHHLHLDPFANRILPGPEPSSHGLVDDYHAWGGT